MSSTPGLRPGRGGGRCWPLVGISRAGRDARSRWWACRRSSSRPYDLLLDGVSHSRLERLDRAVLAYHLVARHARRARSRRWSTQGLVDRSYLQDPWARPYHYALTDERATC